MELPSTEVKDGWRNVGSRSLALDMLIKQASDVHQTSRWKSHVGSWSTEFRGKVWTGEIHLGSHCHIDGIYSCENLVTGIERGPCTEHRALEHLLKGDRQNEQETEKKQSRDKESQMNVALWVCNC